MILFIPLALICVLLGSASGQIGGFQRPAAAPKPAAFAKPPARLSGGFGANFPTANRPQIMSPVAGMAPPMMGMVHMGDNSNIPFLFRGPGDPPGNDVYPSMYRGMVFPTNQGPQMNPYFNFGYTCKECPPLAVCVKNCFNPCAMTCSSRPGAKCVINQCGGCYAQWYLNGYRSRECE